MGMGHALADTYPSSRQLFEQADDLLGFSLSRLAWTGPEEELSDTINTQPALLTHSAASLAVFMEYFPGFTPAFVAGHSMGELSAMVAAGVLSFPDTLRLARRRGELMRGAGTVTPGGMAAILGLDIPSLEQICAEASTPGEIVQVANDNCPGQVVISGASPALERALQLARQSGARRAQPLAVSIPAHSPLMLHAQVGFSEAVESAPVADPRSPIIGNVTAAPLFTAEAIRSDLKAQLNSRVRWSESIQTMIAEGVTDFIELGSGSVLTGLLKRIDRQVHGVALGTPEDFEKLMA